MFNINNVFLPVAVLVASVVIGGFIYSSQENKQQSIERQQEAKNALETLKIKQDECAALAPGVKKTWSNVMGVTYDNGLWEECVVTFTDPETGEVTTSPLRFMMTTE